MQKPHVKISTDGQNWIDLGEVSSVRMQPEPQDDFSEPRRPLPVRIGLVISARQMYVLQDFIRSANAHLN